MGSYPEYFASINSILFKLEASRFAQKSAPQYEASAYDIPARPTVCVIERTGEP